MADEPRTGPYMDWKLPWGETCRQAEKRLHNCQVRDLMRARRDELLEDQRQANEPVDCNKATYDALVEFPPDEYQVTPQAPNSYIPDFVEACRNALSWPKIPRRAPADDDIAWIIENLYRETPDLKHAPSKMAVAGLIGAREEPKIASRLWEIYWTRRLSPGDKTPKPKVFREDQTGDAEKESESHQQELIGRLFGTEEQ